MNSTIRPQVALRKNRDRTNADPEVVLAIAKIEGKDWNPKLYAHRGQDLVMAKAIGVRKRVLNEKDSWSRWHFTTQRRFSFVLQGTWKCYKAYKVLKINKKHATLVDYVINKKNTTDDIYYTILQFL